MKTNLYRVIYMLLANTDENAINEFQQKFSDEISKLNGEIKAVEKKKNYLVKTSENKGARGVFTVVNYINIDPSQVQNITRYMKLAQGTVVNHLILKLEEEESAQIMASQEKAAV